MVGTGKLLAAGHVTSCCPAYISGRQPVSPPLASKILDVEDVWKKGNKKVGFRPGRWRVLYGAQRMSYTTNIASYNPEAYIRERHIRRILRRKILRRTSERGIYGEHCVVQSWGVHQRKAYTTSIESLTEVVPQAIFSKRILCYATWTFENKWGGRGLRI